MIKKFGLILIILFSISLFGQAWDFDLRVINESGGEADTTWQVTLGTDFGGSDGYDDGIDILLPVAPPGEPIIFFPLEDTLNPLMTMLTKDMRSTRETSFEWIIRTQNMYSGSNRAVWRESDFPFDETSSATMQIGAAYPALTPTSWVDMSRTTSFDFDLGKDIWIVVEMDPSIDSEPPFVASTFPSDGVRGVDTMTTTRIELVDSDSGPDSSSIQITYDGSIIAHTELEINRISSGYEIRYLPEDGWPAGDTVCIDIDAQDNAIPPNVMSTYRYCFETSEPFDPSRYPPYFTDFSISDGDTAIAVSEEITFKIRDTHEGVDSSTIEILFGMSPFDFYEVESVSGSDYDYQVTLFPPPGGWTVGTTYDVDVSACDLYVLANCSDTTFSFTVESSASVRPFELPMTYWTSMGTADTSRNNITIKTSPLATDGFDAGIDAASPSPGFTSFGYFPLDDPDEPMIDKLSIDARFNGEDIQWEVEKNRPDTYNGIRWSSSDIEDITSSTLGILKIGYGSDEMSLLWVDMSEESEVEFDPADLVFIRFTTDTSASSEPIIRNLLPEDGDSDVLVDDCISFEVIDTDDGIDSFHLYLGIDGGSMIEIAPSDMDITIISGGYQVEYCPDEPFEFTSAYNVRVEATDFSDNETIREWSFSTQGWCLSRAFTTMLTMYDFDSDTTIDNLFLGIGESSTDSIDPTDVTVPLLPPSVAFYFPCEATTFDAFTTDMRSMCPETTIAWEVLVNYGGGDYRCEWNPAEIVGEDDWKLAIAKGPEFEGRPAIDSFTAMAEIGHIDYEDGEKLWVIYTPEPLSTEPPTYCISGNVNFCDDEDLTTEATVNILEIASAIITDPGGGEFSVCDLDTGSYTLVVTAESYESETLMVELVDEDVALEPVELWSPSCEALSITRGHVSWESEPAESIRVTLGWAFQTTDEDGYYQFAGMIAGDYDICFNSFPAECYSDTCFEITLPEGGDTVTVDFDYSLPTITISGDIMLDSEPFAGIEIRFCDSSEVLTTTDDMGEFEITDLIPGTYCIEAVPEDYEPMTRTITSCHDTSTSFEYFTEMVTATIDIITDCGMDDSINVVINGDLYYGSHHEVTLSAGDSLFIEAYGENLTAIDTLFTSVEEDISVELELYCVLCVDRLIAEGVSLTRPLIDEAIANTLSWDAPSTELTIMGYVINRDGEALDTISGTEYIDDDIDSDVEYEYSLDIIYEDGYIRYDCVSETAMSVVAPDPNLILIIDNDDGAEIFDGTGCAEKMAELLDNPVLDYSDGYTITTENPDDIDGYELTDYDFVILELGISDAVNEYVAGPVLIDLIGWLSYEESGILVEGPDFGEFYADDPGVHQNFFNLFGISIESGHYGSDEGTGNVSHINSTMDVFGREFDGEYAYHSLADRSNDDYILGDAETAIFGQDSLIRMTRKVVDDMSYRYASSIYLNAISDGETDEIVLKIISGILDDVGIEVGYDDAISERIDKPHQIDIMTISPNPFNSETRITYMLENRADISIDIFDLMGNRIATVVNSTQNAGNYSVIWDALGQESGIYYVKIQKDGEISDIDQIILIK